MVQVFWPWDWDYRAVGFRIDGFRLRVYKMYGVVFLFLIAKSCMEMKKLCTSVFVCVYIYICFLIDPLLICLLFCFSLPASAKLPLPCTFSVVLNKSWSFVGL